MNEMPSNGSAMCPEGQDYPHCSAAVPIALLKRDATDNGTKIAEVKAEVEKVKKLLEELILSLKAFKLVVGSIGSVLAASSAVLALAKASWPWTVR